MEKDTREIRKSFSFRVDKANKIYTPINWELPKKTKYVRGIQLTSDFPNKLYYRGAQKIEIGGDELFPEGFDSKILISSISVAPRERFFELGDVLPGDLSVKIRFEDKDHERAAIGNGYNVSVVLLIDELL
ncbi:hypothetical protein C9994_00165 [Marivirga lumbricoides]|uniref:Uncharacterized protein n=1 Tax=Marivirga lumbricoides TaxID=1046115 RepID=A0A2T4DW53_9BACT|nr:hypothetical protein C9994_00165 [Marivirga lumbricoides]